jgi:hypothetical protein
MLIYLSKCLDLNLHPSTSLSNLANTLFVKLYVEFIPASPNISMELSVLNKSYKAPEEPLYIQTQ